ncbi:hypothetical protein IWZ01DRAFT_230715 [Phyllosticta capitalensis]
MILRKNQVGWLLLLLPALSSAAAIGATDEDTNLNLRGGAAKAGSVAAGKVDVADSVKPAEDGRPQWGPFVSDKDKPKKMSPGIVDIGSKGSPKSSSDSLSDSLMGDQKDLSSEFAAKDSVMDDPDHVGPKKGTTGTEGGVSEKNKKHKALEKELGGKVEKVPVSPDEARPMSTEEQERLGVEVVDDEDATSTSESKAKGAAGIQKPTNLPDSPHGDGGSANPVIPTMPKDDSAGSKQKLSSKLSSSGSEPEEETIIHPGDSFLLSFTMILFSEVGDKTFLVAALMAMRHPRALVFSAAFSALIAMTVLSAVLGHAVPTLLPKKLTSVAAALLFFVFGAKLLREGFAMSPEEGVGEEMQEVEAELEEKEQVASKRRRSSVDPYMLEAGRGRQSRSRSRLPTHRSPSSSRSPSPSPSGASLERVLGGLNNLFSLLLSPAWVQTFVMTFLGEWGDRSQIATIAMAAGQDYWWVTGGAISGHAVCTGVAVLGGKAIAGRVSMRVVTLGGAFAFLVFGFIYGFEAIFYD